MRRPLSLSLLLSVVEVGLSHVLLVSRSRADPTTRMGRVRMWWSSDYDSRVKSSPTKISMRRISYSQLPCSTICLSSMSLIVLCCVVLENDESPVAVAIDQVAFLVYLLALEVSHLSLGSIPGDHFCDKAERGESRKWCIDMVKRASKEKVDNRQSIKGINEKVTKCERDEGN